MRFLMLWALSLYLLTTARATDYYFSSVSGNDSHSATQAQDPSTPWKSIKKLNAIFSTLQPGDIMHLFFNCYMTANISLYWTSAIIYIDQQDTTIILNYQ